MRRLYIWCSCTDISIHEKIFKLQVLTLSHRTLEKLQKMFFFSFLGLKIDLRQVSSLAIFIKFTRGYEIRSVNRF